MSELHITYEGVESLWLRMARHLDDLAGSKGIDHHFVKVLCHEFLREGSDGGQDIFEVVMVPAGRTGNHVMCIRFSGAFNTYAALATKDRYSLACH